MKSLKRVRLYAWWAAFCFFFCSLGGTADAQGMGAQEREGTYEFQSSLYASSAVLMDAQTGRVLYEKAGYEKRPMASTTKIMTCIIALENASLEDEVEVSSYACSMPKVRLNLRKGEKYRCRDLLYSLMLESHNDSAVAIAEQVGSMFLKDGGDIPGASERTEEESKAAVAAFVRLMNRKAAELGCADTWFITPNGLDATETFMQKDGTTLVREHSTTAADLAKIMSYCILQSPMSEQFLTITRSASYTFSANGRSYSLANHNAFLQMMDGALSGKTGFTNKAGYCYVGALSREGKTFVVALLACGWPNNKGYKWSDTKKLMEYGLESYQYVSFDDLPFDPSCLNPVPVRGGQSPSLDAPAMVRLVLSQDPEGVSGMLLRKDEAVSMEYDPPQGLSAPVKEGACVGQVRYRVGGVVYRTRSILAVHPIPAIDYAWCLAQVWERFLL